MAGSRRLRRLRLGSRWSCRRARRRPSVSGLLTRPTPLPPLATAPSPWCGQKGSGFADRLPVLNVTLTAPTTESVRSSVALQFCAAEAGCPVDIGEMLRLPGINEVTAEIRAEGDATLLLFSAFLTTSEAPLPQSPVRLGATFRQDCLLADELEVR
uniref:DUF1573 domain-containing protein n=1 Tax=Macrostomum lignano TaxID=282301 RepID=A0A1I8GPB1_9PLAT